MDKKIEEGLKKLGFKQLTKPQEIAIPIISSGSSCLIIAPTGYGKTEAALVPIFDWLLKNKPEPVSVLYITPLRSLNRDLLGRMEFWDNFLNIGIAVRHGDTPQSERRKQVLKKPDILITTPETFQGMLTSSGDKLLKNIQWVIVDEIHELLDNKRGYQLSVGLERLKSIRPFIRIGLSATVRNPGLTADFLRGSDAFPEIVEFSDPKATELVVDSPRPDKDDMEFAGKNLLDPEVSARLKKISKLGGSILVFTNTREMAELLGSRLNLLTPTKVHHSSLSRHSRITAEKSFKSKEYRALVATTSMELGIDIGSVETVVQYSSPRQAIRLIQRVGRSGHSWERISKGLVLAGDALDILESAAIAKASLEKKIEPFVQEQNPLDVLGHQIVGILLQRKTIDEAYKIITGAQAFRKLSEAEFNEVVNFMQDIRVVSASGRPNFSYYYSNLSTIPDSKKYDVTNIVDGHRFAELDEEFVSSMDPSSVFICAGKFWQLVDIDPVEMNVLVEPAKEAHHAPAWVGELIPVSKEIATDVVKLKNKLWDLSRKSEKEAVRYFVDNYPVTREAAEKTVAWVKKCEWPEPAIEIFKNFAFIHASLGSRANEALGKLVAGFFSLRMGYSVGMKADQYRIMLEFPSPTDGAFIQKVLSSIKAEHVEANLVTIMRHTPLFKHRFLQVAKRFGAVSRDADLTRFGLDRLIESFKGSPIEHEALKEIFTEKLDFETLVQSIQGLRNLPVRKGPSPMAIQMLESYAPELIGLRPESEILSALKQRLEKKRFDLTCLYCRKWSGNGTPLTAPLKCPSCGAGLIGVMSKSGDQKSLNLTGELYLAYGRKLLLVLAGRGIGPDTAKKILSRAREEREILKLILQAEKLYARTKRFWKT